MNNKAFLGGALAFLAFMAALVFLPRSSHAAISLASFTAHGIAACSLIRLRRFRYVGWWPLPAALLLYPFCGLAWSLALAGSVYALFLSILFAGLNRRADWLASPRSLMRLLLSLAAYPAPVATLALVLAGSDGGPLAVPGVLAIWAGLCLSLLVWVPQAFSSPLKNNRRYLELGLIMLVTVGLWLSVRDAPQRALVPAQFLFFPLILWAGFRGSVLGSGLVSALVVSLLTLIGSDTAAGWAGAGVGVDSMLTFAFILAGLFVAVLVETQRRHEIALDEFQARVESLVNNSPNLMSLKGLDGRFLMVNRAYAALLDRTPLEMVGGRASDFFASDDAAMIRTQDDMVLRCLEPRQFEESFEAGGRHYSILVTKFPLFDAQGLPAGVGSVDTDITESRKQQQARLEAEEKYRALAEQSLAGIYILQDEELCYINPKFATMLGYEPEELPHAPLSKVLLPDELARVRARIALRYKENRAVMHFMSRVIGKSGELIDVEIHSRLFEYRGRVAIIGVVLDISDRIAADASLKLAAKVFETSAEGILITDADTRIIAVNEAFTRITGYSQEQVLGRSSRIFSDAAQPDYPRMIASLRESGYWQGELIDRRSNGDFYPVEVSLSVVRDPDGTVSNYVGVFSDITTRKQAQERLHFLANHDPLTRLPNRSCLISSLETHLSRTRVESGQLAVVFIDLDRFKLINDSFGHQAGDELLRVISMRLGEAVGHLGMLARLGGDEFTLLVPEFVSLRQLSQIAEDVLETLARPLLLEEHEVFVTGSIGISVFPNDGIDARTLLKNADVAMYRAKDSGKNNFQFFAAEMNTQTFERLLLESGLRQALERDEFELHYQPQVEAVGRHLIGVEVLIRWRHPQLGLVPPGRFIPLAEETGLIKAIGEWVLRGACRQLVAWDAAGISVPRVAVNLSARQFEQQTLTQQVAGALDSAGLAPERLELEITESMIMQNPVEAVRILKDLKKLGVLLSIDDFGTGYSSLSILKRFPLDSLKIDRSFVDGLPLDEDSAAIADAILAMAHRLEFTVVAEGVENEAQAAFLQRQGCDLLQGFHFSKPLPAAEFAVLAESWASDVRRSVASRVTSPG
ncbi:bifunctional diguanylate cyclase/phosphodiesterase [Paludibacterium yongneupense]|uniref:bifunctional diguanylate cyclase/phosphodiesterase n=1 Tax=Paludibacterium yongneupense TaxID=400061 RepID=UPI00041B0C76|nr:EAL domain-containing protein [Paludibacterium yongneupense]